MSSTPQFCSVITGDLGVNLIDYKDLSLLQEHIIYNRVTSFPRFGFNLLLRETERGMIKDYSAIYTPDPTLWHGFKHSLQAMYLSRRSPKQPL